MNDVIDIIGAMDEQVNYGHGSYDDDPTEFSCARSEKGEFPNGRERVTACGHLFPDWTTPRELLEAIAEHIAEKHPDQV